MVLDVVFHDDLMRLRTEHGPANMANMATIRHAGLRAVQRLNPRRRGGDVPWRCIDLLTRQKWIVAFTTSGAPTVGSAFPPSLTCSPAG